MISFQPVLDGNVHSVYFPAGIRTSPIVMVPPSTSRLVAALAPVRHTESHGTMPPKITRPRLDGREYLIVMVPFWNGTSSVSSGERYPIALPVLSALAKRFAHGWIVTGFADRRTITLKVVPSAFMRTMRP